MNTENERPITDEDAVIAEMPGLRVEVGHTEDLIVLQQASSSGPASRIALHKWQLRMLAGYAGLLKSAGPSLSESKVVAMLARRLIALHERIEYLSHFLHTHSDTEHADFSHEQQHALHTAQLAALWVADLEDLVPSAGAQGRTEAQGASTPPPAASVAPRTPRDAAAPDTQKGLPL